MPIQPMFAEVTNTVMVIGGVAASLLVLFVFITI